MNGSTEDPTVSHAPPGYPCPFCFLLAGAARVVGHARGVRLRRRLHSPAQRGGGGVPSSHIAAPEVRGPYAHRLRQQLLAP